MELTKEKFISYYEQGFKDSEIARLERVSESSVNQLRWKLELPPNGRKVISDEFFLELYNQNLTDKEISEISGTSEAQIRRRREKFNLPIHKSVSKTQKLLNEQFIDLYNSGKNDKEIAKILQIGSTQVNNYRNKLELPPVSKNYIDLNILENLVKEGKTDKEIAEILNFSQGYIKHKRLELKLYRGEQCKPLHYNFNKDQEQVIIGSLLGDGCVHNVKGINSGTYLSLHHCSKQKEYIEWKASFFKDISSLYEIEQFDGRFKNPNYINYVMQTKSILELVPYRNNWYTPEKHIYKEDADKLGPLGLAVWYMDDGAKCKPYGGAILCTNCFTIEELKVMQVVLKNNFDLNVTLNIKSANMIYIPSSEFPKFKKIIEPYIIPSMKYKIKSD